MADKEPIKGIWIAIRLSPTDNIPYCGLCEERIQIGEIFAERTIHEAFVVCQHCTTDMLDARLQLIAQGG